jgi:hypothetical protein
MTSAYLYGSNRRIAPRKMTNTSLGTTTIKDSKKRIALVQVKEMMIVKKIVL